MIRLWGDRVFKFASNSCSVGWRRTRGRLLGFVLLAASGWSSVFAQNPPPFRGSPRIAQQTEPAGTPPIRQIPEPRPSPRAAEQPSELPRPEPSRLELLRRIPEDLAVPGNAPETRQRYERFVEKTVDPELTLDVIVGRPRILVFKETPTRIYLPNESVASYQIISDREISVVGNQAGRTVLTVWVRDGEAPQRERLLSYLLNVVPEPRHREDMEQRYKALADEINRAFPNSRIELSMIGDRLMVRGTAHDAVEATQILNILVQNAPSGGQNRVRNDRGEQRDVYLYGNDSRRDALNATEEANLRRGLIDSELLANSGIINLLRIPGEQQVLLRVTIAEVNRSALRQIGANTTLGTPGDVSFVSLIPPAALAGGSLNVTANNFLMTLSALRELGMARTLAEPNLTTLNARTASFRAGDRLPVPLAQASFGGVGQGVGFEFVGVQVNFTPYILDRDRVRLEITGMVSTKDEQQVVAIAGTNVNGQNTRNFSTTVELREGQTMALAGLIQNTMTSRSRRVPFVGDLPLVGSLFGTRSNDATEQELIVIVTPELVHPLESGATPPLPGSDVHEPGDVEFYLGNKLESRRSYDYRSAVRTDYDRIRGGDRLCNQDPRIPQTGQPYGCRPPGSTSPPNVMCEPSAMPAPFPSPAQPLNAPTSSSTFAPLGRNAPRAVQPASYAERLPPVVSPSASPPNEPSWLKPMPKKPEPAKSFWTKWFR